MNTHLHWGILFSFPEQTCLSSELFQIIYNYNHL